MNQNKHREDDERMSPNILLDMLSSIASCGGSLVYRVAMRRYFRENPERAEAIRRIEQEAREKKPVGSSVPHP